MADAERDKCDTFVERPLELDERDDRVVGGLRAQRRLRLRHLGGLWLPGAPWLRRRLGRLAVNHVEGKKRSPGDLWLLVFSAQRCSYAAEHVRHA